MSKAQELVVEQQTQGMTAREAPTGISPLVAMAMNKDMDPAKLAQLFELQKQYEANEAEKAFYRALAEFKKHDITLGRDKTVKFTTRTGGETHYKHTTLGAALSLIGPLLSQYGLSLSWTTEQDLTNGGRITVTCSLVHAMGHSISTSLSGSPDDSGGKNNIQAVGSTTSYLKRYTAFALLGLASMDEDDDGNAAGESAKTITEEQATAIHAKITDNGIDMDKFMAWLQKSIKVEAIGEIPEPSFKAVMRQIDASIKAKARKANAGS